MHPYAIALLALVDLSLMLWGAVGLPIYYCCRRGPPESGSPCGWRRLFAFLPTGDRDRFRAALLGDLADSRIERNEAESGAGGRHHNDGRASAAASTSPAAPSV
jgi:hypothetical protein